MAVTLLEDKTNFIYGLLHNILSSLGYKASNDMMMNE
jgi:hypothetical protein